VVLDRLETVIVGSNPTRGMNVMSSFFCIVLHRGLAMSRSPIQGTLQKCLKVFIVSKAKYQSEQAREPYP
jgi:hypothetical protein